MLIELGEKHPEAWIADIWNVGGTDQIYYQAGLLTGKKVNQ